MPRSEPLVTVAETALAVVQIVEKSTNDNQPTAAQVHAILQMSEEYTAFGAWLVAQPNVDPRSEGLSILRLAELVGDWCWEASRSSARPPSDAAVRVHCPAAPTTARRPRTARVRGRPNSATRRPQSAHQLASSRALTEAYTGNPRAPKRPSTARVRKTSPLPVRPPTAPQARGVPDAVRVLLLSQEEIQLLCRERARIHKQQARVTDSTKPSRVVAVYEGCGDFACMLDQKQVLLCASAAGDQSASSATRGRGVQWKVQVAGMCYQCRLSHNRLKPAAPVVRSRAKRQAFQRELKKKATVERGVDPRKRQTQHEVVQPALQPDAAETALITQLQNTIQMQRDETMSMSIQFRNKTACWLFESAPVSYTHLTLPTKRIV
eukprot:TRINITY_DN20274_c0_g1_i2.p1 TRINITY_DN20274_c0_g1~~TRINITY_DN20274_c0_g1_i2.p1  ORF type:complete len:379 (-),score=57.55 TRINITY_DN20274_c0_g1_i2:126-1262(-)